MDHIVSPLRLEGTSWMPAFSDGLKRFVQTSNEHLLFGQPLSLMAVQMAAYLYLQRGPRRDPDHFLAFAIKVGLDHCAAQLSGQPALRALQGHFPERNFSLPEALKQKDIEEIVQRQPLPDRSRTTMVIAVGRDKCLFDLALARGDRIIAVEPDANACDAIRSRYGAALSDGRLVLEQHSALDEPILRKYCGEVDLLYSVYANSNVDLFTAFNVLRAGALFVFVNGGDGTDFEKATTIRFLNHNPADEFSLLLSRRNARPPYRTPWGLVNIRNNTVLVFQRHPQSTLAGRSLRLPDASESRAIRQAGIGVAPYRILNGYRQVDLASHPA